MSDAPPGGARGLWSELSGDSQLTASQLTAIQVVSGDPRTMQMDSDGSEQLDRPTAPHKRARPCRRSTL